MLAPLSCLKKRQTLQFPDSECLLIAGAAGGIGDALVERLTPRRAGPRELITLSRADRARAHAGHHHLRVDLDAADSVDRVREFLADRDLTPDCVIHCAGLLHAGRRGPEKTLAALDADWLQHSLRANVSTHVHLAQALEPRLQRSAPLRWASISAKVGSIGDNRLGGWYSYRMTKAALNMFVRGLAIEWQRRLDRVCVAAIHPGTTDTPLSEPFQKNIPENRLYSRAQTAQRLLDVVAGLRDEDNGGFFSWDASPLPW